MNPIIFYRVRRPTSSLDILPLIDLDSHYPRTGSERIEDQVAFTIKNKHIRWQDVADIELTDEVMGKTISQFQNFSPDQDL